MKLNRRQRRELKANAERLARERSHCAYSLDPDGKRVLIDHPKAVAALYKAFLHVLRTDLEPHVTKLPYETGAAFPTGPGIKDVPWYLAVGLDVDTRFAYRIEQIETFGAADKMSCEMANRALALDLLRPITSTSGLIPNKGTRGQPDAAR